MCKQEKENSPKICHFKIMTVNVLVYIYKDKKQKGL